MNRQSQGINFFIHDLNPYGGQDRSTLEILHELSQRTPVHVYAFTYENPAQANSKIIFHRCPIQIRRPVLIKSFLFHLWSLWVRLTTPRRLTFATGTCSLVSDVVHVQFVARAWKKERGKLLVRRSGLSRIYHRVLAWYNEAMEGLLFSGERAYAAISRGVAEDLRTNFPAHKIAVIHHGVDHQKFAPPTSEARMNIRRSLGLPTQDPTFLFVGAYDRKGLATVVLAARQLAERFPRMKVVAVGNGDHAAYRELAGEDSSWLILRPNSKEIERYYQAADFFVLPTLYEPFGLVALEAMSVGLPSIVSRLAGASELVEHGRNGLLLEDPTNVNELRQAMQTLLQDPILARAIGAEARMVAEARSWKQVAGEFLHLIEQKNEESRLG